MVIEKEDLKDMRDNNFRYPHSAGAGSRILSWKELKYLYGMLNGQAVKLNGVDISHEYFTETVKKIFYDGGV